MSCYGEAAVIQDPWRTPYKKNHEDCCCDEHTQNMCGSQREKSISEGEEHLRECVVCFSPVFLLTNTLPNARGECYDRR